MFLSKAAVMGHRKHAPAGNLKATLPLHPNLKVMTPASYQTTCTPSENISQTMQPFLKGLWTVHVN
jgi:hypothetical protein